MRGWGTLVHVDSTTGDLIPLFWDPNGGGVPPVYTDSVKTISDLLKKSPISHQHKSTPDGVMAGVVECGGFTHMHFDFTGYWEKRGETNHVASLMPASTSELTVMLDRVLEDNDKETVEHAAYLLLEDKLPYSDKHKGAIRWLQDLYEPDRFSGKDEASRRNLLFYFAARSFIGCINSLRNGMTSELLEMIRCGTDPEEIRATWSSLAGPLTYMRPTAAPKAGNITAAENLLTELKLTENDMRRAFLTIDQIPPSAFLYRSSKPAPISTSGIFASVIPRGNSYLTGEKVSNTNLDDMSAASITFARFVSEVLPTAQKIEYKLPWEDYFCFFITGLPDTAPLMQWHTPTNLASWYVNISSRNATRYKLAAGWVQVPYIVSFPHMWRHLPLSESSVAENTKHPASSGTLPPPEAMSSFKHKQHGIRYLVGLEGVTEENVRSLSLFPSVLKSEMHGVRATIEAYSNKGTTERLNGGKDAFIGGVSINRAKGEEIKKVFRVTNRKGRVEVYKVILFE